MCSLRIVGLGVTMLFPFAVPMSTTQQQRLKHRKRVVLPKRFVTSIHSFPPYASFGVVMIELISSLPAVDITRHRHEINLASMALNRIQNQSLHEIVDPTLDFESDAKVKKMIVAMGELAFQCLQSSKDMRPTMDEVLESLKDIQNGGKHKSQPEVMDISSLSDDAVLLNHVPPPLSPDSNIRNNYTTPNTSA